MNAASRERVGAQWPWLAIVATLNVAAVTLVAVGLLQLRARTLSEAEVDSQNAALAVDLHLASMIARVDLSLQTIAAELGHAQRDGVIESAQPAAALIRLVTLSGW